MSSPFIKIQSPNQLQGESKENEDPNLKLTTERLQRAIKILNLPYDYDFWEILEIFIKVGQIKEYYKGPKEMIIIFQRQDSVFLSRFFNNHQFGKHEQTLKIAQSVIQKDIIDKLFKVYEDNFRIESANTSYADLDFGQQQHYQSISTSAIPPLYNGQAKEIANNISPKNFYSLSNVRTKPFIDALNQSGNPGVNSPQTNQQSMKSSNKLLNIPSKQSSHSPQVEYKIQSQSFLNYPQQQSYREHEKSPNIHSFIRNDNILSKYSPYLPGVNLKGTQNVNQIQKSPIITINHSNSTINQNGLLSKQQSRIDNKIESDSETSFSQITHENAKQKINELNNSIISSSSSNLLEKTKKKSLGNYNEKIIENDEIITYQNRSTVKKRSTRRSNSLGTSNSSTEEDVRQLLIKTDIPLIGIYDERELFIYYVFRRKYLLFLITCYLFYWFY